MPPGLNTPGGLLTQRYHVTKIDKAVLACNTVVLLLALEHLYSNVLMYWCVENCEALPDAQAHQHATKTAWTACDPAHPD